MIELLSTFKIILVSSVYIYSDIFYIIFCSLRVMPSKSYLYKNNLSGTRVMSSQM